jgi:hypothetical protein
MQNTTSTVTIFSAEAVAVTFTDKKGAVQSISAEGALFKGGAALVALKDMVLLEAGNKAANGKYRAAADILAAAFSATTKSFEKLMGTPWTNKATMCAFLGAIERAAAERVAAGKLTAKQAQAMAFVKALRTIPSLAAEDAAPVTIDANLRRVA